MLKIPNPLIVQTQSSSDDNERYSDEKTCRHDQVRVAKNLNWITGLGVGAAIISLVAVGISILQSRRALMLDQRAWIKVGTPGPKIEEGKEISYPLFGVNTGKTAARVINAKYVVEVLKAEEAPHLPFEDKAMIGTYTTGIMWPTDPFDLPNSKVLDPKAVPIILSHDEAMELFSGNKYLAVHGIVEFRDIFGHPHWTHFCFWHPFANHPSSFSARTCTDYNEADNE